MMEARLGALFKSESEFTVLEKWVQSYRSAEKHKGFVFETCALESVGTKVQQCVTELLGSEWIIQQETGSEAELRIKDEENT